MIMKKILIASIIFLLFMVGCENEAPEPVPPVPVVSIIGFAGTVNIVDSTVVEVGASDDKGIVRVELYLNNTLTSQRVFIQPPFRWYWNVKNLPDSSLHVIYAKAYDADGNVSTSSVVIARILRFTPNTLRLFFLNDTAAVLQWNDVSSIESGFEVEESNDGVNFTTRAIVPADTTYAVVLDSFYNDSSYYYRVRALTDGRRSEYSNIVSEKVEFIPPVNLRISYMDEDSARLEWDDPHNFAQRYEIWTRTDESPFVRVAQVPGNTRSIMLWNLYQTTKNYFFRIKAKSNINLSDYSNTISKSLDFPAPDNLVVLSVTDDVVRLRWRDNAVFGSFFEIERQLDDGPFLLSKTVPRESTTATLTFAYQRFKTYSFRMYSRTSLNTTLYSDTVKIYFKDELYVGGNFTYAGAANSKNIARWNGTTWAGVGNGLDEPVYALKKYFERIFIGGKKTITAWDSKSYSTLVGNFTGDNDYLYSMADTNGRLYAGGRFGLLGAAQNGIGMFNGSSWEAMGTGMNGPVYAVSYFNNTVIAAGNFTEASNRPVNNIAKRTNRWDPIGSGLPSTVYALAVYDNELYAGGSFTLQDSVGDLSYVTKWNILAERWLPVASPGMSSTDSIRIYAMTVFNNELYVGGRFSSIAGVSANNIAKWDGIAWHPVGSGVDGVIRNLYVFNNELYVGGKFVSAGGVGANNIAKTDGIGWATLSSGITGTNATVHALGTFGSWYWEVVR